MSSQERGHAVRRTLAPESYKLLSRAEQMLALAPWHQNLHLPDGTQTAPEHALGDYPQSEWSAISTVLPADLTGWRVLDIGCNAGFYSIEFARRGACVTAMDVNGHCLSQARWAATQFGVTGQVEFRRNSVYDLAGEQEQFDLVWSIGVLDALRYRLLALDVLRRITRRLLVVELTAGDELLRDAGFRIVGTPRGEVNVCEPDDGEGEGVRIARLAEMQAVVSMQGVLSPEF